MFVFKASTIIEEIKKYFPDILENCVQCLNKSRKDLDFLRIDESAFKKCKDISIDVAVLEKTTISYVLPLDCGWDDIGSWGALWQTSKKDFQGNSIKGKVFSKTQKNSLIRSQDKLIVSLGIKDLIIVDTKDALLVADKDQCQDIKEIVNTLKKKGFSEAKQHKKVYRPWGNYLSIEEEKNMANKKNSGKSW